MNRTARLIATGLAAVAFLLLGYAWYSERQENTKLNVIIDGQSEQISRLLDEQFNTQNAFYFYLSSQEGEDIIFEIAQTPSLTQRQQLASNLSVDLNRFVLEYGAAEEVIFQLDALVSEPDLAERSDIAAALIEKIRDMSPFVNVPPAAIVSIDEGFTIISTLVAVLGSVGSALASAFLFLTGGTKRRIEQDMLAIDLEKQKVELAQMQYEAREAIAATRPLQGRSEP